MNALTLWFHKLGSPPYFHRFAGRWLPWLYGAAALSAAIGLYYTFFASAADYLQGESVRILYIHVPCAWMSLFAYVFLAVNAFIAMVWRIKLSENLAMAAAPVGAAFTCITLATGALWGRPTWGTYWVWDARLTSELVLLFLYFGVIGLYHAIEDPRKAARAASLLALIGLVNIPIIHFSVEWWNTLHQGASIKFLGGTKSSLDRSMLPPLLWMTLATKLYFGAAVLARARVRALEQESGKDWVRTLVLGSTVDVVGGALAPTVAAKAAPTDVADVAAKAAPTDVADVAAKAAPTDVADVAAKAAPTDIVQSVRHEGRP